MLGVLAEKALATPQNYPLSINALATACNQSTNRDPITHYSEAEIADELAGLKERRLLRFVHPTSGRGVTKYRHVLDEHLGVGAPEIALLSVLLVRGPQTLAELRARTERLHTFADTAEVEETLRTMRGELDQPLAQRLEREPGAREPRWVQLLCPQQGLERAAMPVSANPVPANPVPANPVPAAPPPTAVAPQTPGLERDLADLRRELERLRQEFDAFRAEFG